MGMMDDIFSVAGVRFDDPFSLQEAVKKPTFVLTGLADQRIRDVDGVYVADPCVFTIGGQRYLFVELLLQSGKGVIAKATWDSSQQQWSELRIVISEPYHLSYPRLIVHDGKIYMTVESAAANDVHIYLATSKELDSWKLAKTLIEGTYYDPTVFLHDDVWYMFACRQPEFSELCLFYSMDGLLGKWIEHSSSPIVRNDSGAARPAGPILNWKGQIFRLAQDCSVRYGRAVKAFDILTLTADSYEEGPARVLLHEGNEGWNDVGMHHIQLLDDGSQEAVVDGYYSRR